MRQPRGDEDLILHYAQASPVQILPLVCLPTVVVGYLSYDASVDRVARLSREEQMLRAEAAANEINWIFELAGWILRP